MADKDRNTEIVMQYPLIISILFFLLVFNLFSGPCLAYAADNDRKQPLQFSKNHDISQVKPRKPVKIKLHRSVKGEYQWEITGDNADDVVRADKRLRKLLEVE